MAKFYISDTHFNHANIIRLANRPFADAGEMDRVMMRNWNSVVGENDDVYHMGDFAFTKDTNTASSILNHLNGRKHLIIGNHDSLAVRTCLGWKMVSMYLEIEDNGRKVVLFHYPITEWNGFFRGSYHLHGHVHGKIIPRIPRSEQTVFDVGVECIGYTPKTLDQLLGVTGEVAA